MLFCVIPPIAFYTEYIKIRVGSFDLIMQLYWKAILQIFELNFEIVKYNCLPTCLENNINVILKSRSNLFMGR